MANLNIHIYPSPLTHESRILRITDALSQADVFDHIEVLGVSGPGLPDTEAIDARRTFIRCPRKLFRHSDGFVPKLVKTLEWSVRVLASMRGKKPDCINAHSLAVLPLCYLASRMTGARLVYDTHELETETTGYKGMRQRLGRLVERLLIHRCDAVFTVSDMIADWYETRYGIQRPTVVRNIPQFQAPKIPSSDRDAFRTKLSIPTEAVLFIYQGGFISGRGIERLLKIFGTLPTSHQLLCMGSGPLQDTVALAAERHGNIHLLPSVPPQQVLAYTGIADVGICLTDKSCLSHDFSLPNKIFEYMQAGLPFIVNPLAEQKRLVESQGCGWVASGDDHALRELLLEIGGGR